MDRKARLLEALEPPSDGMPTGLLSPARYRLVIDLGVASDVAKADALLGHLHGLSLCRKAYGWEIPLGADLVRLERA